MEAQSGHGAPRRSPWQLLALPIAVAFMVGIFIVCAIGLLQVQRRLAPGTPVFCAPTPVATAVLFVAVACFSVFLGFLLANMALWLLPFTRRVSRRTGRPAGPVNMALAKAVLAVGVIAVPVSGGAISSASCISETEVYYRSSVLSPWRTYSFSQITEVRPTCSRGGRGGGFNLGLDLALADGTTAQLDTVEPWFATSSDRVLPLLRGLRVNASGVDKDCPAGMQQIITPPRAWVDSSA